VRACHHGPRGPWVLPRPARAAVDAPALGFARLFPVIPPAGITTGGITGKRRVSAMRRGLEPRLLRARAGAPRRGPRPSPAYPRREAGDRAWAAATPPAAGSSRRFSPSSPHRTFCAVFACAVQRTLYSRSCGGREVAHRRPMRGAAGGRGSSPTPRSRGFPEGSRPPGGRAGKRGGRRRSLSDAPLLPRHRPAARFFALYRRRGRGRGAFPTRGQAGGQSSLH